ncbi:MAG: hypothetical protein HRU29_01605 [Rhizobiales bacterium]|nr:hypothetical protein [Hyphomicrobiales bacterium]NRB13070.1 hypothetical protein [Hyphomicrobiales bacterium]
MNYLNTPLPTHYFLVEDAAKHGVEAAVILHHFKVNIERNQNLNEFFIEETYWCSTKIDALLGQFPYFKNRHKIERLIKKLVNECAIVDGNHNNNRSDQTKWYALQTAINLNAQNRALECADLREDSQPNNHEQTQNNSPNVAENLNAQKHALQCADVSIPMRGSEHSHNITNIESIDRVESAQVRDNNGFGLKEFVERFNCIPNGNNKVEKADEVKIFRYPAKVMEILENNDRAEIEAVFSKIENNHYLLGQTASKKGVVWELNIGWLTAPKNWESIASGGYDKHVTSKTKSTEKPAQILDYSVKWSQFQKLKNIEPVLLAVTNFIPESRLAQAIVEDGQEDKLYYYLGTYFRQPVRSGAPIITRQIEYQLLVPFSEYRKPKATTGGAA